MTQSIRPWGGGWIFERAWVMNSALKNQYSFPNLDLLEFDNQRSSVVKITTDASAYSRITFLNCEQCSNTHLPLGENFHTLQWRAFMTSCGWFDEQHVPELHGPELKCSGLLPSTSAGFSSYLGCFKLCAACYSSKWGECLDLAIVFSPSPALHIDICENQVASSYTCASKDFGISVTWRRWLVGIMLRKRAFSRSHFTRTIKYFQPPREPTLEYTNSVSLTPQISFYKIHAHIQFRHCLREKTRKRQLKDTRDTVSAAWLKPMHPSSRRTRLRCLPPGEVNLRIIVRLHSRYTTVGDVLP